jgi:hypothetical protein
LLCAEIRLSVASAISLHDATSRGARIGAREGGERRRDEMRGVKPTGFHEMDQ